MDHAKTRTIVTNKAVHETIHRLGSACTRHNVHPNNNNLNPPSLACMHRTTTTNDLQRCKRRLRCTVHVTTVTAPRDLGATWHRLSDSCSRSFVDTDRWGWEEGKALAAAAAAAAVEGGWL